MDIKITGRHVEVSRPIRNYTQNRVERLSRFSLDGMKADVKLFVEKYRHSAEILFWFNGDQVTVKEETDEMYRSIDGAVEKIENRLRRYKSKRRTSVRRKGNGKSGNIFSGLPASIRVKKPLIIPTGEVEDAVALLKTEEKRPLVFFDDSDEKFKMLVRLDNNRFELTELIHDSLGGA